MVYNKEATGFALKTTAFSTVWKTSEREVGSAAPLVQEEDGRDRAGVGRE